MQFHNDPAHIDIDKFGMVNSCALDTSNYIAVKNWTKFKNLITHIDEKSAEGLNRFIHLKDTCTDYMTKLELIDSHPSFFIKNPKYPSLNKFEME